MTLSKTPKEILRYHFDSAITQDTQLTGGLLTLVMMLTTVDIWNIKMKKMVFFQKTKFCLALFLIPIIYPKM